MRRFELQFEMGVELVVFLLCFIYLYIYLYIYIYVSETNKDCHATFFKLLGLEMVGHREIEGSIQKCQAVYEMLNFWLV